MVCDGLILSALVILLVLILILLEYGLRPKADLEAKKNIVSVLILILLEYGLRHSNLEAFRAQSNVS